MNKETSKLLTALLGVLFGVFALIKLVPDVQLAIGFLSLTFGLVAIFWTYRAKASLSSGTSLREYTTYFLFSLVLIVFYSLWDTLIFLFEWQESLIYPKYFLITLSYLIFLFTSFKILHLGKQFGFQPQVEKMNLKKRKVKKKLKKTI